MKSRPLLLLLTLMAAVALIYGDAGAQMPIKAPRNTSVVPAGGTEFGYIPPPMDLSHIKAVPGMLMGAASSWDWRALGGVTSVKNQNPYGTCWAFAALGNLESQILINDSVVEDFSEFNIQGCNPVSTDCNAGGNAWMSTNYLALLGAVDETCDPYPGNCPLATCNNFSCDFLKQVVEWKVIPNDVASIKNAVQTYGPVYVSMYASFAGFSTYNGSYCITYAGTQNPNHAVLIVGWDDTMCGGTGAWIVKNSWGSSWGDNGYFYIAYGSARIGENANVITAWKDFDSNETIYYYDEYGWWSSVGYGDGDDWGMVAITPAGTDEYLYSVDFWASSGPCNYSIYVYDNFSGGVLSTLLAGPITGSVAQAGYYSFELPAPLAVTQGNPIYLAVNFVTPGYNYPVPYDDSGPMETNKCYIRNTSSSTWSALDNGNYAMGDVGIRGRIAPEQVAGSCSMEGDPGFFFMFEFAAVEVVKGQAYCDYPGPTNFGFLAASPCKAADTFCVTTSDLFGWTQTGGYGSYVNGQCFTLGAGSYYPGWEICITVPCDATVGQINTWTAVMGYCDLEGVCAPDCGDCQDPNVYGGVNRYSTISMTLEVVQSPPALLILQDELYFVEQGATAAYVPFSICNGDPCAPATNYGYSIRSLGVIGAALNTTGTVTGVLGGLCADVYGIVDAGDANVCDYDTLTIIAWDAATGTVYDTCVQVVHVVEPVPVPLFSLPAVIALVAAMVLAAAVIMRKRLAGNAR
jgi:C1A family cysteine protease